MVARVRHAIGAVIGIVIAAAPTVRAADTTYYQDVRPILQTHCQSCHRPPTPNGGGLVAPMPLTSYEETRPWARSIAREVVTRRMPPWFASGPHGVFENERVLSDDEIRTIVAWAGTGAPAGDPPDEPPAAGGRAAGSDASAGAAGGWSLGTPDLIVRMPNAFFMEDDAYDAGATLYTKLTDVELPADTWMRGWEIRAGEHGEIVHHMCVGVLPPGQAPRPAGEGGDEPGRLGCIAAGSVPAMLPACFGRLIEKGSAIWFNMHYHKKPGPGTAVANRAEIGFYFAKGPAKYLVRSDAISNYAFEIPSGRANYRVGGGRMLEVDTWLVALWPHGHLRATGARYTATYPDGRSELLLDVPRYDQNWQVTYNYKTPKLLPAGTMIDVSFWYDNTRAHGARRGFDADRVVTNGPRTNDEMALWFLSYAEAGPWGDSVQCEIAADFPEPASH